MRTIHLDAVGGIAGDMFVAAMLDAFPHLRARVLADAAAVLPREAGTVSLEQGESAAVRAVRFGLVAPGQHLTRRNVLDGLPHDEHSLHEHSPTHHLQPSDISDEHGRRGHGNIGTFRGLVELIEAAALSPGTATQAAAILTILASAEARIHQVELDDVHFHEIADWDSLLDVVAAGSIAAAMGDAVWSVSALPRGGGLVLTQHGLLPVPAPATAAILEGFAWRDDGIPGERVTPTGAAILKHLVRPGVERVGGILVASGTGAGTRSLPGMPNILRALSFETPDRPSSDTVTVIAFEVDDMTGEEIGVAAARLRAVVGVLDLSIGQRWGKKGRPVQSFALLVRPEVAEHAAERCFAETSTIGLRLHDERRIVLKREARIVDGVGVKTVQRPGGPSVKAESDDLPGDCLAARRAAKHRLEDVAHD